jgi:hypothetical protein
LTKLNAILWHFKYSFLFWIKLQISHKFINITWKIWWIILIYIIILILSNLNLRKASKYCTIVKLRKIYTSESFKILHHCKITKNYTSESFEILHHCKITKNYTSESFEILHHCKIMKNYTLENFEILHRKCTKLFVKIFFEDCKPTEYYVA